MLLPLAPIIHGKSDFTVQNLNVFSLQKDLLRLGIVGMNVSRDFLLQFEMTVTSNQHIE